MGLRPLCKPQEIAFLLTTNPYKAVALAGLMLSLQAIQKPRNILHSGSEISLLLRETCYGEKTRDNT